MNKNIWELYKNSERGKNAIELFTITEGENDIDWAERIFKKYNEYFGGVDTVDYCVANYIDIIRNILADKLEPNKNERRIDYFERLIDNIEIIRVKNDENGELFKDESCYDYIIALQKDYKTLGAILSELSLALYALYENSFVPILFREQFDLFMKILDVLEIPMPELPAKTNKRGRLLLYSALNENILAFADKNDLSLEETCACIYDYAFLLMEEKQNQPVMPKPTNVWLTGGSKGDYKAFLENPLEGEKSVWTCNEKTKRGDIIVMYVLSPYSCIQSMRRADIDGVYTPFNYYNSRTRVTDGIVVPHITLKELKADEYFSKLPITRKNFQGVNGVRLSADDYRELLLRFENKGFDTSVLPKLYNPNLKFEEDLKVERDVEEKLLIPLLKKLGFQETDWSRNISQKAGRTEKAIPDFVFLPTGEKHFQNAPMVIEAKFDMSSNLEQTKAYNQALSYARMMKSNILGICDKERLIIYLENNGHFDRFSPSFENYWPNLNDEEVFRKLKLLIGKENL